jgi:hypothetical protein
MEPGILPALQQPKRFRAVRSRRPRALPVRGPERTRRHHAQMPVRARQSLAPTQRPSAPRQSNRAAGGRRRERQRQAAVPTAARVPRSLTRQQTIAIAPGVPAAPAALRGPCGAMMRGKGGESEANSDAEFAPPAGLDGDARDS